ncbi:MAG: hypothetical protein DRG39_01510 [Deltaproteobacteria bacterium]|nr:MAG: hypothetical protein DRG39_01510 [Deltaproteobacteria bacterium]
MKAIKPPVCPYCGTQMKKWKTPPNSTWTSPYNWVCFNDECPYFVRGWDHIFETQGVKASYRHMIDPDTGNAGPLPCWSYEAHKDKIIED